MIAVAIAIGGFLGTILRVWSIERWNQATFPVGTLVVNGVGSFLMGALSTEITMEWLRGGLLIGFCGALTTFATVHKELLQSEKGWFHQLIYSSSTYLVVLLGAWIGYNM